MPFNAMVSKKRRAMERLRGIVGDDLRPGDMDGIDAEKLLAALGSKKYARHGTADGWFETPTPYQTSPLVNPYWEAGGRWRDNFPGSGDQHINDDGDKEKSTRGNPDDNDPGAKNDKINQLLEGVSRKDGVQYVVKVRIMEGQDPEKIRASLGSDAKYDGRSVQVIVDDFSEATGIQRKWPGAIVETVKKETGK